MRYRLLQCKKQISNMKISKIIVPLNLFDVQGTAIEVQQQHHHYPPVQRHYQGHFGRHLSFDGDDNEPPKKKPRVVGPTVEERIQEFNKKIGETVREIIEMKESRKSMRANNKKLAELQDKAIALRNERKKLENKNKNESI